MINVIASIHIKEHKTQEFIEIFKANIQNVLKEKGCLEYVLTVDFLTDLPPQELNEHVVTVIEKWTCIEDLYSHLAAPHMLAYKEKVKNLVVKISLKILTEV